MSLEFRPGSDGVEVVGALHDAPSVAVALPGADDGSVEGLVGDGVQCGDRIVWPSGDMWWEAKRPGEPHRWAATPGLPTSAPTPAVVEHVLTATKALTKAHGSYTAAHHTFSATLEACEAAGCPAAVLSPVLNARGMVCCRIGRPDDAAEDGARLVAMGSTGVGSLLLATAELGRGNHGAAREALVAADAARSQLAPAQAATLDKRMANLGVSSAPGAGAGDSSGRYPSTPHLPFSPEVHDDDTVLPAASFGTFLNTPIVITEKLDGGNCAIIDGKHESFGPIKTIALEVQYMGLEPGLKLFGENMFGVHSIEYDNLEAMFYLFAVQHADGRFDSWEDVVATAERLGLQHAPVVFEGTVSSMAEIRRLCEGAAAKPSALAIDTRPEGFVLRLARGYAGGEFERCMAKFVRKGHLQTDDSWRRTWKKAVLQAHTKRK